MTHQEVRFLIPEIIICHLKMIICGSKMMIFETLAWGLFFFQLNEKVESHSVLVQLILEPKLF